jgi:hypothetical protein
MLCLSIILCLSIMLCLSMKCTVLTRQTHHRPFNLNLEVHIRLVN